MWMLPRHLPGWKAIITIHSGGIFLSTISYLPMAAALPWWTIICVWGRRIAYLFTTHWILTFIILWRRILRWHAICYLLGIVCLTVSRGLMSFSFVLRNWHRIPGSSSAVKAGAAKKCQTMFVGSGMSAHTFTIARLAPRELC